MTDIPGTPCPECAGKTRFDPAKKRTICESCGLTFTKEEEDAIRRKLKNEIEKYDSSPAKEEKTQNKKKRRNDEYLDWWTSEHGEQE